MPFISDAQLARVQGTMATYQGKMERAKKIAEAKAGEIKQVLESVGAAGAICFIRGRMEKTGTFTVPGTSIDIEMLAAVGLIGAAMADLFGKYDEDVLAAGIGIACHYVGQVARGWGKTGSFSMVAGSPSSLQAALASAV